MIVNKRCKAAQLLAGMGADPTFDSIVLEVKKRAEEDPDTPGIWTFTDGSQMLVQHAANVARVVHN